MSDYTTVCRLSDLTQGQGRAFNVKGRMIAVFLVDGQVYAIDDFCPHMGASLAGGYVDNGIVTCPWHAWRFALCDGTWCDSPRIKIDTFPVRVVGDEVQVAVPEP